MTMSDGALDLSVSSYEVPSQRAPPRPHDQVSSDSGRASSDSTSSDVHDDVRQRVRSSPHAQSVPSSISVSSVNSINSNIVPGAVAFPPSTQFRDLPGLPPHIQRPTSSSASPPMMSHPTLPHSFSNPSSPNQTTGEPVEEDMKPSLSGDKISDSRVAPIRPFKMYPVDPFNVYSSSIMSGAGGTLSPTPVGIQSLYDSASQPGFPSFPLTPLTSHLLQRKRRAESRDTSSTSTTMSRNGSTSSIQGGFSDSARVSTSDPVSPGGEDSNGSDGEKRMKLGSDLNVKKDDAYWDRRRKNNEAAKRSRDARRQKEEEIAMRAAFLEQENLKLRAQVAILKNETAKLHYMLYNRM